VRTRSGNEAQGNGMQIIPTRGHGVLDYVVGVFLVLAPWLFGFGNLGAATWTPVVLGLAAILYSAFTDYELGLVRVLPMRVHLGIDTIHGLVLGLSPWLLGFAVAIWAPHVMLGAFELLVIALSQRNSPVSRGRLIHAR
jgi:hypothetical protein